MLLRLWHKNQGSTLDRHDNHFQITTREHESKPNQKGEKKRNMELFFVLLFFIKNNQIEKFSNHLYYYILHIYLWSVQMQTTLQITAHIVLSLGQVIEKQMRL